VCCCYPRPCACQEHPLQSDGLTVLQARCKHAQTVLAAASSTFCSRLC
jgi:hypothetical protein